MNRAVVTLIATLMFVLASSSLGIATGRNESQGAGPQARPAAATETNVVGGVQNLPSTTTSSSDYVGLGLFAIGAAAASGFFALTLRRRSN